MRRGQYPHTSPSELVVFASRMPILCIDYHTSQQHDDPLTLKELVVFIKAFKQLIASPDKWNGEERVSDEVMCLPLFIYHNISIIDLDKYMRKHLELVWSVPKTNTTRRVCPTLVFHVDYTICHFSDYSDLLDDSEDTLLARPLEEHGGIQHDTSLIPVFIEKLNNSEALFSVSFETRNGKVPDMEFIRFYGLTRFERDDDHPSTCDLPHTTLLAPS